jgi:protein-disulfide isomerase
MHDQLYQHQDSLEDDDLRDYADALDLDSEQFARELHEHVHEGRVEEDIMSGARSGVNGTPTFFINGERFDGNWTDVDVFVSAIEERIQSLEQ